MESKAAFLQRDLVRARTRGLTQGASHALASTLLSTVTFLKHRSNYSLFSLTPFIGSPLASDESPDSWLDTRGPLPIPTSSPLRTGSLSSPGPSMSTAGRANKQESKLKRKPQQPSCSRCSPYCLELISCRQLLSVFPSVSFAPGGLGEGRRESFYL